MKICGIVGWKNSGKTFFVQKLVSYFVSKKFKVASIKHAHHTFDIDKPGTDSFLHREAGSEEVIISSSKRWAMISETRGSKEKTLKQLVNKLNSPDIVIVEGFKKEEHLKLEIINSDTKPSNYLFPQLKGVIGIVSDKKIVTSLNQFKINETEKIANYILNNIYNE